MAEQYNTQVHRCFNCGYCKFSGDYSEFNCPSYVRFRLDTFSTSGRLWLIYAWLKGEVEWSEHLGEILYTCVTCKNCTEQCVMRFSSDIVDWIIAARRDMMEKEKGRIPSRVGAFLQDIYRVGNPLKARQARGAWADGIKRYQPDDEYLLYVGCLGSFDDLAQEMARSLAEVMRRLGISFGVLGDEERCCGNEVYTLGEATLFEMLAAENVRRWKELKVEKVIALSPHSYNAIKNLYPDVRDLEVMHYSQFLLEHMRQLRPALSGIETRVTYHDPCYLGRYNQIYDPPREVLSAIPGLELVEMPRVRENAFCCGGGSGNFAMDLLGESRESPNRLRVREACSTGANTLAVCCPSCLTMLSSAVKSEGLDEQIVVTDVAQLVRNALGD